MRQRDKRLIAALVVLNDQLPMLIDGALADQVSNRQWREFADALAVTVRMCRDQGVESVIDAGDAGGR